LLNRRSARGGFGDYAETAPTILSTAFALRTLSMLDGVADAQSIGFLLDRQQADGGWSFPHLDSNDSSVQLTAYVFDSLWRYRNQFSLNAVLDSAQAYLLSQQQASSNLWSDTESSALTLIALVQRATENSVYQVPFDALTAQQLPNGSFENDVYLTALITQLIQTFDSPPADIPFVTGRIIDAETRLPLQGVTVNLNDAFSAVTDNLGEFIISNPTAPNSYEFSASLNGYSTLVSSFNLVGRQQLDLGELVLSRVPDVNLTASIIGTVSNIENGNPLSGALVNVLGSSVGTITGADGQYQIVLDSILSGTIQVSADGFINNQADVNVGLGQTLVFSPNLVPVSSVLSTLSGVITDQETAQPLGGVMVTLISSEQSITVETSVDGAYQIPDLIPNTTATISASLDGYQQSSATLDLPERGQVTFSPSLVLEGSTSNENDNASIFGSVVDGDTGQPLANAQVDVRVVGNSNSSLALLTDDQGGFLFEGLPEGEEFLIQITLTNFQNVVFQTRISGNLGLNLGQVQLFRVSAPGDFSLEGRIVDASTQLPVAGASVTIFDFSIANDINPFVVLTNEFGEFSIDDAPRASGIDISADGFIESEYSTLFTNAEDRDLGDIRLRPSGVGIFAPDLIVENIDQTAIDANIITNAVSGSVSFSVRNRGNAVVSAPFTVIAFQDIDVDGSFDLSVDTMLAEQVFSENLNIDAVRSVTADIRGQLTFRDAPISIIVDSNTEIVESDETNNVLTQSQCMANTQSTGSFASINESVYLNSQQIVLSLGANVAAEPFVNLSTAESLINAIDASSASSMERYTEESNIQVSGAGLELVFDLGREYDLETIHFWNYFIEESDVDNIDFRFFNANNQSVGQLLGVEPSIGAGDPITSEDIAVSFQSNVRFIRAIFTADNGEVDFNNIGFTASLPNELNGVLGANVPQGITVANGYKLELFAEDVTTQQGPTHIAVNSQGDLFIALGDSGASKIPAGTNTPESFGETNVGDSDGIVVDSQDNVIVAGNPVTKYAPDGSVIWQVNCPVGNIQTIAVDEQDVVYVGSLGSSICRVSPDGQVVDVIGGFNQPSWLSDSQEGLIYVGQLSPRNIAVFSVSDESIIDTLDVGFVATQPVFDNQGLLHVGKGINGSNQAAVIDLSTNVVKVIADGFANAQSRAFAPDGSLFIADATTSNIYKITPPNSNTDASEDYTASALQVSDNGVGNNPDVTVRIGNASNGNETMEPPTYITFGGDDFLVANNVEPVFEHSIEFWLRLHPGNPPVTRFGNEGGPGGFGALNGPFTCQLGSLFRVDENRVLRWRVDPAGCGNINSGVISIEEPLDEEWNHISGTYDGTTARLYFNGELVGEQPASYTPSTNFILGTDPFAAFGVFFEADIDDVRIWRRALSDEEVSSRFCEELNGDESGLALYWQLNEGQGDLVNDLSGSGNNVNFPLGDSAPSWGVDSRSRAQCRVVNNQVDVTLYNGNPSSGGQVVATKVVDAPLGGRFQDVVFTSVPNLVASQELFAVVDAQENVSECNETNNVVSLPLDQASTIGELGITLSQTTISANEELGITSLVSNIGILPADYSVSLKIEDAAGDEVANLPEVITGLISSDSMSSFLTQWNTERTLAGQYQVNAQLRNNLSELIDSQLVLFTITDNLADNIQLRTSTDRFTYNVNDTVELTNLVQNLSPIQIQNNATLQVSVADPSGAVIFTTLVDGLNMTPSFASAFIDTVALNNAEIGEYTATGIVLDSNNQVLSTSSGVFNVANDLTLTVIGNVEVDLESVEQGEMVQCVDTLTNSVEVDISDLPIRQLLVSLDEEQVLIEGEQSISLLGGEQIALTREFDTIDFTPSDYSCALQAFIDDEWVNLDNDFFTVVEPELPVELSLSASVDGNGRVLVLIDNEPDQSPGSVGVAEQRIYLETLLTQAGWLNTVTSDSAQFASELASNSYTNYVLLASTTSLSEQTQSALQDAVSEGAGLIEAGNASQRQAIIDDILGIEFTGQIDSVQGISLQDSDLQDVDNVTLSNPSDTLIAQLNGASIVASYLPVISQDGQVSPAITLNDFGNGRSVYIGFDLIEEASLLNDFSNDFAALLINALNYATPNPVLNVAGNAIPVTLIIENDGRATPGRLQLTLPDDVNFVGAISQAVNSDVIYDETTRTITQLVDLEISESIELMLWLSAQRSATLNALLDSGVEPDFVEQDSASIELLIQEVQGPVIDSLGVAGSFNAFICDEFTSRSSDSHGRIAAGGNVNLDSYGLASRLPSQPETPTLIVGGDLSYGQGKIFVGSALVAGSTQSVNQTVVYGLENGATVEGNTALPIDIDAEFANLRQLSSSLALAPSTATVEYKYGGIYITGDCSSETQVFNLDGPTVLNSNHLVLNCVPNTSTIIFNIDGNVAGFRNIGLSQLHSRATNILYNFHEAETVQFTHVGVEGTVLAPSAHIDNPRGQINGSIIAKSWNGPMELHDFPFMGSLEPILDNLPVIIDTPDSGDSPGGSGDNPDGTEPEETEPEEGDTPLTIDGLGSSQSFNAFIYNDFNSQNSDSHGKIAVGGNASFNSYGLASRLPSQPETPTLIVGGNLSFGNGKIFVGSALVGGSTDNVNQSVVYGLENGASIEQNTTLPIDFEAEFAQLRLLSSHLSQATQTGTVDYRWGGIYIDGDCSSETQVFNLDGATVLNSNHLVLNCVPNTSTIIFNIAGNEAGFRNIGLGQLHNRASNILYNFYEAETVRFTHVGIEGTVLAPNAHFDNPRGQINGSVIAESWDGSMELHDFPFIGSFESVLNSVLNNNSVETDR